MAIRKEQPGAAKAAATAGTAIDQAKRVEEDRARAEREQVRADIAAAQRKARQVAMEWDLKKAQINEQRTFERDLRVEDYKLAAEDRAHAWQIEKMELASRMDFEQDEKERLRESGRVDAKITALKKAQEDGLFTGKEFEFEDMMTKLEAEKFGIKGGIRTLDPQQRMLYDMQRQQETDASGGVTGPGGGDATIDAPPAGPISVRHMEAIAAIGKTYVVRKTTGENVAVPIGNAEKAIETGRFVWPNVVGTSQLKKQFPDIVRQETTRPQGGTFTF